jgi:hypothetical protein
MQLLEEIGVREEADRRSDQRRAEYQDAIQRTLPPEAYLRDIQDDAADEVREFMSFDTQDEVIGAMWFIVAMIVIVLIVGALIEAAR